MDYKFNMNSKDFVLATLSQLKEYRDLFTDLITVSECMIEMQNEAQKFISRLDNNPFLTFDYDFYETIEKYDLKLHKLESEYFSILDKIKSKGNTIILLSKLRENEKEVT